VESPKCGTHPYGTIVLTSGIRFSIIVTRTERIMTSTESAGMLSRG
jgi:hypothetical protein